MARMKTMISDLCKMLVLLVLFGFPVSGMAQTRIEGHVVNEHGEDVEYASVRIDSFYVVSDQKGHFQMNLPKGEKAEMVISHLSYKPFVVAYGSYKDGNVKAVMKENVSNLAEVSVSGKKLKEKKISHKGIKTPGDVTFRNVKNTTYEVGPIVANKKDFLVKSFNFQIKKCSFSYCVIRVIVYEIKDKGLVPIQSKPIYLKFTDKLQKEEYSVKPVENLMLKKGHDYYVGVAVVSSNGDGEIHFPAFLRKGYVRNLISGKMKKLPATLGISMTGVEVQ